MILTYKVLSLLLDYPSEILQESLPEISQQLREEAYLDEASIGDLEIFIDYSAALPLTHWQEQYVTLFDQGKKTNLYLFDHVYGSSGERGQAMSDLLQMYAEHGIISCADELPDYLPLYLEFLATQSDRKVAEKFLAETKDVLIEMQKQLVKQQTPYARIIDVICRILATTNHNIPTKTEKGEKP